MVRAFGIGAALIMSATAATAQALPHNLHQAKRVVDTGAASAAARLQAQGYSDIHDLKKGPDGNWTAVATRNGLSLTVVEQSDGKIVAR
ncbi:MAG: hypothetical protein JOY81_02590 [Alphaproteobacteria bacterium]|nr:hypothetical protein [Alphaproteobacteria bacterium]MBV8392048.1 hypothetical protein [Alphaproteobacteria bacterium]